MPPAKKTVQPDSDSSSLRDRQIAAAAHARKSKNAAQQQNGSLLKGSIFNNSAQDEANAAAQNVGMNWSTVPLPVLNTYRVAHNINSPAAFTTPLRQAYLTNPGIGRQSPTMARRKEKRRVPREQLALAVRKNFNSAAVSESEVVVDLIYKVRHQGNDQEVRVLANAN